MSSVRVLTGVLILLLTGGLTAHAEAPAKDVKGRAFLGVMTAPAKEPGKGILVREVLPGSPAATAGLKSGDVILKADDQDLKDAAAFVQMIGAKKPGDKLSLRVLRDGKEQTIAVSLGAMPPFFGKPAEIERHHAGVLGVRIEKLTPAEKQRLGVSVDAGAVVVSVLPDSPADRAGVRADDVIVDVNNQAIKTPADVVDALRHAAESKEVTVEVIRGKEKMSLHATPRFGGGFLRDLEKRLEVLEKRLDEMKKQVH